MFDQPTRDRLAAILRRESRSLLLYLRDAYPWTSAGHATALDKVREIIDDAQASLTRFAQYLSRAHVPAHVLASYPSSYTSYNFMDLDCLLPILISDQKQGCIQLEKDLAILADPEARGQVERLLQAKQGRTRTLEALSHRPAAQAVAS